MPRRHKSNRGRKPVQVAYIARPFRELIHANGVAASATLAAIPFPEILYAYLRKVRVSPLAVERLTKLAAALHYDGPVLAEHQESAVAR